MLFNMSGHSVTFRGPRGDEKNQDVALVIEGEDLGTARIATLYNDGRFVIEPGVAAIAEMAYRSAAFAVMIALDIEQNFGTRNPAAIWQVFEDDKPAGFTVTSAMKSTAIRLAEILLKEARDAATDPTPVGMVTVEYLDRS